MKDYAYILESILHTLETEIQKATEEKEEAHREIFTSLGGLFLGIGDERYYDRSESAEERETVLHGKIEGLTYACDLVRDYIKNEF